jgi:transposase
MKKIREVIRLHLDRRASVREIAIACGIGRTTVGEYPHRAKAAELSWPLPEELSDVELTRMRFPPPARIGEPARPPPDWSFVQKELSRQKGMTLLLLWQEYKREFPNGYGYSRYAGLYRDWAKLGELSMLQRHKAGEKLFVDWAGLKAKISDPKTGEVRKHPVFVAALGASH